MSRIGTKVFGRLSKGDFKIVKLQGLQNGSFCLMIESAEGCLIHENADGRIKEYPKAESALAWLKRTSDIKEVVVDIAIWRVDSDRS